MVLGVLLALVRKNSVGEAINLGNQFETSIIDLAKEIIEVAGSRSKIVFSPLPEDDPKRRCPKIEKAKKILGWTPKVTLEDGLERTVNWFRTNPDRDSSKF